MQTTVGASRWWRRAAALLAVGLAAGCSVYRPLDQGSPVPWAQAHPGAGEVSLADGAGGAGAAALPGYRVRPGDRLGLLAERFGLSVAELAEANGLRPPYVIRIGEVLRIPGAAPRDVMVADGGRGSATGARDSTTVRLPASVASEMPAGENLATSRVAALDVSALPPLAGSSGAPAAAAGPAPRLTPATAAAPGAAGYTVRRGETLSGIARRLDVGLTELARANGIAEPYRVYAGQQLHVPEQGSYRTTTIEFGGDEPRTVRLATGAPPPLDGDDFLWPVNGKVIGRYGPIDQWRRRDGIDIAARRGAPVLAAQDGIVVYAGDGIRGYGQMVLLRHGQDYITTYAHNATLLVQAGDVVRRGQVIARVGDSGDATQTMLHFELRKGRRPLDPETRLVHDARTLASAE
jgi:murein DD-endopeptidase MepM/ murein hydrolase activator NlpD